MQLNAAKPNPEDRGQINEILQRLRKEEAKRKTEQDEVAQRPTNARCEGGERMAEVQLKVCWACYPLHATPMEPDKAKTGTHPNHMQGDGRPVASEAKDSEMGKDESNTRKHLLKVLRTSIEVQGKADAKRRKCLQAMPDLKNSREGGNHMKSNRDNKVEASKGDLQGYRTNDRESQSILNIINAGKQR